MTLLNLCISCSNFFVHSSFPYILSCHLWRVKLSFLPIWFPSFCCIIAETRSLSTMLNNSGESGHPCLVSDHREKSLRLSPLRMILVVSLSHMAFMMLMSVPSIPTFFRVFMKKGYYILSNAFSVSIEKIIWLLSFLVLIWCIILINLQILNPLCSPGINPTWWCWIILLMYCWIQFVCIMLRIFASRFNRDIGL